MMSKPQVTVDSALPTAPAPEAADASGVRLDRRALLRAGAGASPVLLAFASRPVAAANSCVVASSFVSVATFRSRNPTTTSIQCSSKTCESWHQDACLPEAGSPSRPAALAPSVSKFLGATTSQYNSLALWEVMKNNGQGIVTAGELGVLQHMITLGLNIQTGNALQPGNVSLGYLQTVWQNYVGNGGRYIVPTSAIDWDTAQIISWLRMLIYPVVF